ncbi:MAG: hypothetical protein OHK93_005876 [Ramalina farinacea]|uniref:Transcription initiation factor TFIID subunit 10 n=1 Tax=Ramalina farinacea TaxID=258253 RepID=A0AA43TT08_9LECA|nr:hypothetical protein [Ramalina farinacea]
MSSPPPSAQPPISSSTQPPPDTTNDTLDPAADLDVDLEMQLDGPSDGAANPLPSEEGEGDEPATLPEPREPTKKDISLRDFVAKMDDYAPIIPDALTSHHLLLSGLDPSTTPLPLQRLLALATQKFIADVAADAYQYSRMRSAASSATATATTTGPDASAGAGGAGGAGGKKDDAGKAGGAKGGNQHVLGVQRAGYGGGGGGQTHGQGKAVLTMEDLGCAVGEYGVNVRRGEFYR